MSIHIKHFPLSQSHNKFPKRENIDWITFVKQIEWKNCQQNFKVRAQDNVPVILVANKVDLEQNGQRRVTYEEGKSLANKVKTRIG